jgi:hypothetical protein
MLHVRLAQTFQTRLADALGKPKESGLHIRRKGSDFSGDSIVQDFNSPSHINLYLNFEIYGRGGPADFSEGQLCNVGVLRPSMTRSKPRC